MVPILAAVGEHSQQAPDTGWGIGLIIGTIAGILLAMILIWLVLTKTTRFTRGGVERKGRTVLPHRKTPRTRL